ncbi:Hit Diadenosine tetraphosphate (Ap4A) hydrolase and other HIT family hydrolases [Rhabdaerophilaceae bacterium]
MSEAGFQIDARLEADCYSLGEWPLCRVLLMDDARYPWLILVPRRADLAEITDLPAVEQVILFGEITRAMGALSGVTRPDKMNMAALGNTVSQLHVHVIARYVSDEAWPGPVWGKGQRRAYPPHMVGPLMDKLCKAMELPA